MSSTELGNLEALLEQVLPDPQGYAERVVQQLLDRLAATPQVSGSSIAGTVDQTLVDRNLILAAALGACECWGEDADCPACAGAGAAGWVRPDPKLYEAYVRPARSAQHTRTARESTRMAATDPAGVQPEKGERV